MDLNRAKARAKRIEDAVREKAFLPVLDEINGVVVRQFTLRHLMFLFAIGSPFVYGGPRKNEDVIAFLWIVSPHYTQEDVPIPLGWWNRFGYRLKRIPIPTIQEAFIFELMLHPRWDLFRRAINRYLYFAYIDKPAQVEGSRVITASYAAAIIHRIATAYHWNREEILDTPLGATFQLLKWIAAYQNPKTPQFTPLQSRVEATMERLMERTRLRQGYSAAERNGHGG